MNTDMIDNTFNDQDLSELRKLIGKRFSICGGDNFDEMHLAVRFQLESDLYLMNIPTHRQDQDEYPLFSLTASLENEYEGEELCTGVLEKVSLVRDEVCWTRENHIAWKVTQDVGIKFYFHDFEVLIMSVDSLAGFLKCKVSSQVEVPTAGEDLLDYWKMKVDELGSWKRTEMIL